MFVGYVRPKSGLIEMKKGMNFARGFIQSIQSTTVFQMDCISMMASATAENSYTVANAVRYTASSVAMNMTPINARRMVVDMCTIGITTNLMPTAILVTRKWTIQFQALVHIAGIIFVNFRTLFTTNQW